MKTVTAAIIIRDGKVLVCRRAAGEKLAGFWEFPGGKLEDGETLRQCLERELLEELGVRARAGETIGRSIYCYDHGEFELVGMRAELLDADINLAVHDSAQWASPDELLTYKLAPADIPLAEILIPEI